MTLSAVVGAAAVVVWAYLLLGRGFFWLARERDDRGPTPAAPVRWPSVAAVVPARNEADVIERALASLLAQDYPGDFRIIMVDDGSDDGTGALARPLSEGGRLTVIAGAPLPSGWTGKVWAQSQGIAAAGSPDYLLLTDADIAHGPDNVRRLVARSESDRLVLASLMARLALETWADRLLIPAFVFFFAMLYPFAWVNDPGSGTAAAAGGCMLVRREALQSAGGIAMIRAALIDDCALAALMKRQGAIRIDLTNHAQSLRPYARFGDIAGMVSRSAYAQLNDSPLLLAGTVIGMGLIYLAAPVLALLGAGAARGFGLAAWLAMVLAFQPMLAFYRRSPAWGLALPLIGALYTGFTLQSALAHWRGRGGMWKGRAQAMASA